MQRKISSLVSYMVSLALEVALLNMAVALAMQVTEGMAAAKLNEAPNLKTGFALSANLSSIFLREWGGK